ncbi:MAG: HAMP domain-containing histidine kinase [Candidatus Melainabacteria bacterium]|nr:HAMP domain-containing histidine kinase [Candidatus Melainabacteria bacterium]
MKIFWQGAGLVCLPLIVQLTFVGVMLWTEQNTARDMDYLLRAQALADKKADVVKDAMGLYFVFQQQGLSARITRARYQAMQRRLDSIREQCRQLRKLAGRDLSDSAEAVTLAEGLEHLAERIQISFDRALNENSGSIRDELPILMEEVYPSLRKVKHYLQETDTGSERILKQRLALGEKSRTITNRIVLLETVVSIILSASLLILFSRSVSGRLSLLGEKARMFARGEAPNLRIAGKDEVSELDSIMEKMFADIQSQNALRQAFVQMLSHDLKTPINVVSVFAENLKGGRYGELNELGRKRLSGCLYSVAHCRNLVRDFLEYERLTANSLQYLDFERLSLPSLVLEVCHSLGEIANEHEIKIEVKVGDVHVFADQSAVRRILNNLLSNAISYEPKGGHILVESFPSASGLVAVSVTNHGSTLSESALSDLFKPFAKTGKRVRALEFNTGLGLSIVKLLVEANGGEIKVDREFQDGCRFVFTLSPA